MSWIKKNWLLILIGVVCLIALNKQCEKQKTITKTVTKIEYISDTIRTVEIKEVPKIVYVERTKTIKGKDSIIYKDKPNDITIQANQYQTTLKSNDATAEVQITTTGQLLDVKGIITYPKVKETLTVTKTKQSSGLFIYGDLPITNNFNPEVGAIYQFKNTALIKTGIQYNSITNNIDFKIGIGIKIF